MMASGNELLKDHKGDDTMKDLYNEAYEKEHDYYINKNHEKIYIPSDGELASGFIKRVLNIAKFEQSNNDLNKVIFKCQTNPFCGYALVSFKIDSDDDLNSAVSKYKKELKRRKLDVFGG